MRRIPLHIIVIVLLLLAAAGMLGGSLLAEISPYAQAIGWGAGLLFACLAAIAASRLFASEQDE